MVEQPLSKLLHWSPYCHSCDGLRPLRAGPHQVPVSSVALTDQSGSASSARLESLETVVAKIEYARECPCQRGTLTDPERSCCNCVGTGHKTRLCRLMLASRCTPG